MGIDCTMRRAEDSSRDSPCTCLDGLRDDPVWTRADMGLCRCSHLRRCLQWSKCSPHTRGGRQQHPHFKEVEGTEGWEGRPKQAAGAPVRWSQSQVLPVVGRRGLWSESSLLFFHLNEAVAY